MRNWTVRIRPGSTAMTASFLRASLFTSVVAYGISAMAMGIGLVFGFVGTALMRLSRPTMRR